MYSEDNRKMLVVLSPGFPANEMDTSCLPAQQSLIRSINKTHPDLKVVILAFEYPHTHKPYTWHGNEVIPFNGNNKGGVSRLFRWIKIWRELNRLKKENEIQGMLSFWLGQCALIGKYFGKANNINHFIWVLGQDARKGNHYVKWIKPDSHSVIAMSDFLATQLQINYSVRPTHIIPNGIDTTLFNPIRRKRDIDIIGVGSLIPLKQYALFIEIIKDLKKEINNLHVILCGEGTEKVALAELIKNYQLEDTITLTGEKKHEEILQLLQRSRLMLHPSSYEGFSGACLEALYAGAQVVSFQQPMNGWIRHWHIAENTLGMVEISRSLLLSDKTDHKPVLPYTMEDTARSIMHLFTR